MRYLISNENNLVCTNETTEAEKGRLSCSRLQYNQTVGVVGWLCLHMNVIVSSCRTLHGRNPLSVLLGTLSIELFLWFVKTHSCPKGVGRAVRSYRTLSKLRSNAFEPNPVVRLRRLSGSTA
jgi:hypothetical protein